MIQLLFFLKLHTILKRKLKLNMFKETKTKHVHCIKDNVLWIGPLVAKVIQDLLNFFVPTNLTYAV